jgi:uncharacterized protein YbjT (DUF2867 family)
MKLVIAGATGNIGGVAAAHLLAHGHSVRLPVRNANKAERFRQLGAEIAEGDMEDADFLKRTFEGAEALFWLTPPNFGSEDLRAWHHRISQNAAAAVRTAGIQHVVNLSGLGTGKPGARGLLRNLHEIEQIVEGSGAAVTHLRPGWFMENLDPYLAAMREQGQLPVALPPDMPLPLIATTDIGTYAAEVLESRKAHGVVNLVGPELLNGTEIAEVFSHVLGRRVEWAELPPASLFDIFQSFGATPQTAQYYVELFEDFQKADGPYALPLPPHVKTSTTLAEYAAGKTRQLAA